MSIFDPIEHAPYGHCSTCALVLNTEAEASEHMNETVDPESRRSHSVRITNPTRPMRIRNRVANIVDDAIYDAMEALDRLVERGDLNDDEVTKALRMWPDFGDVWSERIAEGGE